MKYGIPILVSKNNSESYQYAQMYGYGRKKIYFESTFEPKLGSEVCVILEDYSQDSINKTHTSNFRGKVLWCKEILDEYTFNYRVNVQISAPMN